MPPGTVARSVLASGTAGPRTGPAQLPNATGNIAADRRNSARRCSIALLRTDRTAELRADGAAVFVECLTIVANRFMTSAPP